VKINALLILGCVFLAACCGGSSTGSNVTPASPFPSPSATASSPSTGGLVIVQVPTPAPVLCSPSPVTVAVGQTVVIDCTSAGYNGPIQWAVADPGIASIRLAEGTFTFFYVSGVQTGTTSLTFSFPAGGAGSELITVAP
jgi:hypothetical protein